MANINNLEMAAAVSSNAHVAIRKSLFGLRQTAVYEPTGSPMTIVIQEYAPADGERLQRLLRLAPAEIEKEIQKNGKPASTPVGHFRLEAVVSADHKACALQLFTFADFRYTPASDFRFFEGQEAEVAARLL